jgi:hypothetical protein
VKAPIRWEFVLYFGPFEIDKTMAFLTRMLSQITCRLSRIHIWLCPNPANQREHLNIGCNRLMGVIQTIFNQASWRQPLGYMMLRGTLYVLFRWLIHVSTLCNSWIVRFSCFTVKLNPKLCNKRLCASLWYRRRPRLDCPFWKNKIYPSVPVILYYGQRN